MRVLTDPVETGAVTLALPQDVQAEAYDWPDEFFAERTWTVRRPGADPAELAEAVRAIRAARRPLIVAGGGVHHSRAEEALAAFAEATGIPVASTQAGKGSLRHDHPQDVGGIGHTGTATADELARAADLVIGVGTRYTDFTTASDTLFQRPGVRFLNLNIAAFDGHKLAGAPAGRGRPQPRWTQLTGALRPHGHRVSRRLRRRVRRGQGALGAARRRRLRGRRTRRRARRSRRCSARSTRSSTSRDIIINAAGSLPGDLHKLWRARSRGPVPRRVRLLLHGIRDPGRDRRAAGGSRAPVWALVGDGTYLMNADRDRHRRAGGHRRSRSSLLQNHGYASIGGLSESVGGERFGTAYRYRAADGTYTGAPLPVDLAANAASLGMRVLRAKTVRDLREALAGRARADTPTCVYVETETADTVSGAAAGAGLVGCTCGRDRDPPVRGRGTEEYDRHVSARRRHL